jgi:hypothetical protein
LDTLNSKMGLTVLDLAGFGVGLLHLGVVEGENACDISEHTLKAVDDSN